MKPKEDSHVESQESEVCLLLQHTAKDSVLFIAQPSKSSYLKTESNFRLTDSNCQQNIPKFWKFFPVSYPFPAKVPKIPQNR